MALWALFSSNFNRDHSIAVLEFEAFLRRVHLLFPSCATCDVDVVSKILIAVLKIPSVTSFRGILDPLSKILSFAIQVRGATAALRHFVF